MAASNLSASSAKKVLLCLTGGIAVYKSAELCRALVKAGCDVRVVMSAGAQAFVTPLTFQALSGNPVHSDLLDPAAEAGMGHIELAKWPDLILVAPASANFIASYAQGLAGDLLGTLLLASDTKVAIAPAMNQAMWSNPLTQKNLGILKQLFAEKLQILGPASGEQACGDVGLGRMLEPEHIVAALFSPQTEQRLAGKRVVLTAGPTREAIDPVRFISNHSSGKMGYALARACEQAGAEVVLVSGPVNIAAPEGVKVCAVESARDMLRSVETELSHGCDIFIATAAVADYRPELAAQQKMKKQDDDGLTLSMVQNPDIVASVAARENRPFVVGFAAETNNVHEYATNKLHKKRLDMVVANDVSKSGLGFNSDDNEVHIVCADQVLHLPRASKQELAGKIVAFMSERCC